MLGGMTKTAPRQAYKELRLQQLRSFCATARLGSLTSAAEALGLAQPTVWEQVHALEKEFGGPLVERHARGCRLTDLGRLVAERAAPLVAGIDALKRTVQEARGDPVTSLTLASTQRILAEDVSGAVVAFLGRHPHIGLRLLELPMGAVVPAVESGAADLGLTSWRDSAAPQPGLRSEPAYELEHILVTPRDHPLARRRRVGARDLARYPLLNARDGFADPAVGAALDKLGAFRTGPRRVEAMYTAVIRRYAALGLGIGLVVGRPGRRPSPAVHERSMSQHFGRVTVDLVWRDGSLPRERVRDFARAVRAALPGGVKDTEDGS